LTTVAKVFLVLLVIGAIALSTASITMTAQTLNWKELADGYRLDAQAVWAASVAESAQSRVTIEQLNSALQAANTQLASAQADLAARQKDLGDLRTEIERLKVKSAGDDATLAKLTASLQVEQNRANQLQEQNQQALARALDLEKRNIDLNDRVSELTSNVNVLENQARVLQQQNYSLKETVTQLREQMALGPQAAVTGVQAPTGAAQPMAAPAVSAIRGKVVAVEGNVVGLSVGAADGVKRDMAFVIYRGDTSLGRMLVRDVDAQASAGTLDRTYGPIQVGDLVINEAGLMAQQ